MRPCLPLPFDQTAGLDKQMRPWSPNPVPFGSLPQVAWLAGWQCKQASKQASSRSLPEIAEMSALFAAYQNQTCASSCRTPGEVSEESGVGEINGAGPGTISLHLMSFLFPLHFARHHGPFPTTTI